MDEFLTVDIVSLVLLPKSSRYELSVTIFHYHIVLTSFSTAALSGGKVDLAGVTAGVMVLVLLTLLGLTAGVTIGVVLGRRRAMRKRKAPKERGKSQERSNSIEVGGAIVNTFDVVYDDICIDGRVVLYQGLDVGTQDYVSVCTQLRGGIYQELDPRSREEEHHYQKV